MNTAVLITILATSVAAGAPVIYATVGEIFAERSGILNLGVEGMMLMGAVTGFIVAVKTGNPWAGVVAGMLAGGLLSLIHAFLTITLHADQVVSGLALTIFGAGLSSFVGQNYVGVQGPQFAPIHIPVLTDLPVLGPLLFNYDILVYLSILLIPLAAYFIHHTRPGLHLRAVGEDPTTADVMGVNVARTRYIYTFVGGLLAGLGGAALSLAYTPGWTEGMSGGRGWIAIALVIFAFWEPWRAMVGAYLFGGVQALQFNLQAVGITIPTYYLNMLPYLFTIIVLVFATGERMKRHLGAPAALGIPYIRGER